MDGINRVEILGRLTFDPTTRRTADGTAVVSFSVAASKSWVDKEKKVQERTEFIRVTVWDKRGETCAKVLRKGWLVHVEGSMRTSKYQDAAHPDVTHYSTEVVAAEVRFLAAPRGAPTGENPGRPVRGDAGRAAETNGKAHPNDRPQPDDFGPPPPDFGSDDIPF